MLGYNSKPNAIYSGNAGFLGEYELGLCFIEYETPTVAWNLLLVREITPPNPELAEALLTLANPHSSTKVFCWNLFRVIFA